ncbi:MAG: methyltransferase domain-containing protein [Proteobacteria bacterium]|nr:methyltransferase domain-containing protein [Pseudomonadota bacterium]
MELQKKQNIDLEDSTAEDDLGYLNTHFSFGLGRKVLPAVGLLANLKAKIITRLRTAILGDYLEREQEFFLHLIRSLNDFSKQLQTLSLRDQDMLFSTAYSLETKLQNRVSEQVALLHRELDQIREAKYLQERELEGLNSVVKGLETIAANVTQRTVQVETGAIRNSAEVDYQYLLLENRYRGSEAEIKQRLSIYPKHFTASDLPVVELGTGRGELQELFRECGINSYAVELDSAMIELCRKKGLDIREEDIIKHLAAIDNGAISGFIAVQVIEHLPIELLKNLILLLKEKVVKGGKVIFETINSESILALSHNYFRDPTHTAPLHPETMKFILEISGFKNVQITKLSPYPEGAMLAKLEYQDYMPPRWQELITLINRNFQQLNSLIYGHQDYSIVAEV